MTTLLLTLFWSLHLCYTTQSVMTSNGLNGEYYLTGVHEMAAGFRFTPEGRFDFFYIYGVADRMATGTYTLSGDTVKLHSEKPAGADFLITKSSPGRKGCTITVRHENPLMADGVRCMYFVNGQQRDTFSDREGRIQIDTDCEKVYLQHMIFPDIATLIKDDDNPHRVFEVIISPDIHQVSFKGIDLFVQGDTLTCHPNYFMPMENIRFVKAR